MIPGWSRFVAAEPWVAGPIPAMTQSATLGHDTGEKRFTPEAGQLAALTSSHVLWYVAPAPMSV